MGAKGPRDPKELNKISLTCDMDVGWDLPIDFLLNIPTFQAYKVS